MSNKYIVGAVNSKITRKTQAGFTLVELSVVIVIIGFLVAGITAGVGLVKQAQLRSIVTDINVYQTAFNGFVNKYNGVPGDISVASSYWPTAGAAGCAQTTIAACDGDSNGEIDSGAVATGAGIHDEVLPALRQLQLSTFIFASISTVADGAVTALTPGIAAPQSKVTGAGYMITAGVPSGGNAGQLTRSATAGITAFSTTKNFLYLGKASATQNSLGAGSMVPNDAFNIDQKLDDGGLNGATFAGYTSGKFRAKDGQGATANNCITAGGSYNPATTTTDCLVGWQLD